MSWSVKIINRYGGDDQDKNHDNEPFIITTKFSPRFSNEKIYFQNNDFLIIFDGILLNSKFIINKSKTNDLAVSLINEYKKQGINFLKELNGSFNGSIFDKRRNKWYFFVSQFGDRPLFYYSDNDEHFVSTDFNELISHIRSSGKDLQPNIKAAYYILTYGYMIDNSTHVMNSNRLLPGEFLEIDDRKILVNEYFRFTNNQPIKISFEDAIEELDKEFRYAVERIFEKDLEYGFDSHLADMSAGLDSRMTSWVAKRMGYSNITNICYAQSQSSEWRYALDVANKLSNDFLFMPLDKCNFIYDIDKIINLNYGLAVYAGLTGAERILSSLNFNKFGLEMTGQLGDVIIGTFVKGKPFHTSPIFNKLKYSNKIKYDYDPNILAKYDNHEVFALYTRGLLGALSTHIIRNNYTDVVSPFMDLEVFSLCLNFPIEYRIGHKLYKAWICEKYPDAGRIYSTKFGGKPNEDERLLKLKQLIYKGSSYAYNTIQRQFHFYKFITTNNMNPFDYWYYNDKNLQRFIIDYFDQNINLIGPKLKLRKDMQLLFHNGTTMEKILVLTVLGVYKNYGLRIV